MYSLDSGQVAFWDFDATDAPLKGLSIGSSGWRSARVPSEQHLSLCSLSWQHFMEVGRGRFLLPKVI